LEILIIRPAALGDTLMLLPGLDQIRDSSSIVLAGRRPGILYVGPFARLCLDFEGQGWHTIFTDRPEVPNLPRVDLAAAFLRDIEGKVSRNLRVLFPDAQVHVFPGLPGQTEGIHAALHLARCLKRAGCEQVDPEACIGKALLRPLLGNGIGSGNKGRIIFHPGSGSTDKNHSSEFWIELIEDMGKHAFCRGTLPILLLGPAEEGLKPLFEAGLRNVKPEVISSPDPARLTELLRDASLYLGQDSGVTHLAAMLGTPTIALFRKSSVQMWRPLGPRVMVIKDKRGRMDASAVVKGAESFLGIHLKVPATKTQRP
jgi:hypothetical protein